ncbi:hypothetical protein [Cupriavidus pinatubonensis]|uniref:hypothetical protein n=1 Tax=Cupriavidus pinatubonensis TaxID=248026 RepID=UPI00360E2E0D
MLDWNGGWPTLQDVGRWVEIESEDRRKVGRLCVRDEGEEDYLWYLLTNDGEEIGFAYHDHWRFA